MMNMNSQSTGEEMRFTANWGIFLQEKNFVKPSLVSELSSSIENKKYKSFFSELATT